MTEQDLKIQELKELNRKLTEENNKLKNSMERILTRLKRKEVLEDVASVKESKEESLLKGYVLGIKKAIKTVNEEGGIE